jgi:hypothetical protein
MLVKREIYDFFLHCLFGFLKGSEREKKFRKKILIDFVSLNTTYCKERDKERKDI